ncbi:hypothetical protein WICMUC_003439 [Wickerhamomyces mucosus]|uniref:BZIP domain-containing protein n=1 Tax=Wickerhamomyces mucosus TaxID=1378264 RepID=A0A9P8PLQ4_9ASCO|nr:hypothetical protein WICMUC_003439 [Wickerhamomyces mucosus]
MEFTYPNDSPWPNTQFNSQLINNFPLSSSESTTEQTMDECIIKNESFNNNNINHNVTQNIDQLNPNNLLQFDISRDEFQSIDNNSNNNNHTINSNNDLLIDNHHNFNSNSTNSDTSLSPNNILNHLPLTPTNQDLYSKQDDNNINNNINNHIIQIDYEDQNLSEEQLIKKRKAQNRAAQRAFRERKELKLKELEDKLNKSESDKFELLKQIEDLKKQNIVVNAENKILLQNTNGNIPLDIEFPINSNEQFSFPTSDQFYSNHHGGNFDKINSSNSNNLGKNEINHSINHFQNIQNKNAALGINGVWEFVNDYNDKNEVDINANEILHRLKGKEICKENGAAYDLNTVVQIFNQYINETIIQ